MSADTPAKVRFARFNIGQAIVDPKTGAPTAAFVRWINDVVGSLESAVNGLISSDADIEYALSQVGILVQSQQEIADEQAAMDAAAAAAAAQANVVNSYVSPSAILSATTAAGATTSSVTIANHNRILGNGTSIAVTGATLTGLTPQTYYYVTYNDAAHTGGAVSYVTTTDASQAAQGGIKFLVGLVYTPPAGNTSTGGDGATPPGVPTRPLPGWHPL